MEQATSKGKSPKDAFLEAYTLYADDIFRYCFFRLGDRELATDLVQDVYMKAWKFVQKGDEVLNMRAFLYKIAGNMVIDQYRKRKPQDSLDTMLEDNGFEPGEDNYERMVDQLDGERVMKMFSQIPEPYKEALSMKFVGNLTLSEMAKITGEAENTLAVRIHRAMEKLQKVLEGQKGESGRE